MDFPSILAQKCCLCSSNGSIFSTQIYIFYLSGIMKFYFKETKQLVESLDLAGKWRILNVEIKSLVGNFKDVLGIIL
jgi:hypothetical protein